MSESTTLKILASTFPEKHRTGEQVWKEKRNLWEHGGSESREISSSGEVDGRKWLQSQTEMIPKTAPIIYALFPSINRQNQ